MRVDAEVLLLLLWLGCGLLVDRLAAHRLHLEAVVSALAMSQRTGLALGCGAPAGPDVAVM